MDPLSAILVLVAVALTAAVVTAPLQRGRAAEAEREHEAEIADLEAAKAAKYREIREAEMDYRTGKLSEADWRAIDRELRAEAVELLRRLDRLGATAPGADEAEAAELAETPDPPAASVGQPPAA